LKIAPGARGFAIHAPCSEKWPVSPWEPAIFHNEPSLGPVPLADLGAVSADTITSAGIADLDMMNLRSISL
jgi:hypothetical protein